MSNQAGYLKALKTFSIVSLAEGWSFVLLVFIAMPVKYGLKIPELVQYIGMAHGLLFVAYVFILLYISLMYGWKFKRIAIYFLASLIPFAPFWVHKQLKAELNP